MASNDAERRKRPSLKGILLILIVAVAVILAAWSLVTVSKASEVPPSAFVPLPTTPLSKTGESVNFVSVSAVTQNGVAVGVKGYLQTPSGQPVAGATVYAQYYYRSDYRTQGTTTDQNGYFEIRFPMNWTGWIPVTLTYFGDAQHQGLMAVFSLSGENL